MKANLHKWEVLPQAKGQLRWKCERCGEETGTYSGEEPICPAVLLPSDVAVIVDALNSLARDCFGSRTGQRADELATLIRGKVLTVEGDR